MDRRTNRTMHGRFAVPASLAFVSLLAVSCNGPEEGRDTKSTGLTDPIALAITPYSGTALVNIALEKGFFQAEGLKVTVRSYSAGKAALDAVLDGGADVATCAELPIALAVLKGQPVAIIATVATGGNDGIVGRIDRGISGPATLKSKRIAVTLGTSADFFLDALLIRQRLSRGDVQVINRKPEEMANALASGEVDAVSTWEPYLSAAYEHFGDKAFVMLSKGIYESTFNLAATRDFVGKRRETVKKLLRALVRAEQLCADDRPTAEKIVAGALKSSAAEARRLLSKERFTLSLDQTLVVMMEDESRWAIKNRFVEATATPNFLNNIYLPGLLDVKPTGVTVIH